jgi:crotonobetainyl-CoA:carnitine CoA-transferase CaiB-like acyl-CoA transferase
VTRLENKFGPGALEKTHGAAYKNAILREMKDNTVESAEAEALDQALDQALDAMSKDELLAEAAKRGVKAEASMTKARIIEAIETAHL